jgi:hypothetical protein
MELLFSCPHLLLVAAILIPHGVVHCCLLRPLKKRCQSVKLLKKSVLRIRDVYPGSRILIFTHPGSLIPDPKTATKERGEKKLVVIPINLTNL